MRSFIGLPTGVAKGGAFGDFNGLPTGVALVVVLVCRTIGEPTRSTPGDARLSELTDGVCACMAFRMAFGALTRDGRAIGDGGATVAGGRIAGGTIPLRGDVKEDLAA